MSAQFQSELRKGLTKLGTLFQALANQKQYSPDLEVVDDHYEKLEALILFQQHKNGWFTPNSVREALLGLSTWLNEETLSNFTSSYSTSVFPKKIAVIMAGNIPLVGFHDFLCVLLSGHHVIAKVSKDDASLLPAFAKVLEEWVPGLAEKMTFSENRMTGFDAVIATGSNNSFNYFEQYFGKYPHIFRKNRTSIAILDGTETQAELEVMGKDIFAFFGLGCRNISHLFLPKGFNTNRIFEAFLPFSAIVNHHKYANNYDYQRSVMMLNKIPFLENGFVILKEDQNLHSPLSEIHYSFYKDEIELSEKIKTNQDSIQAIVGKGYKPFGSAQKPEITDFADGVDTMEWLVSL